MATVVQRRRGTTAQHATFTGALAELTVDTDKDTVVVHDGSTAGGFPLLKENLGNLADDAVTFAKVQNIATSRVLGRTTAGSGDIEELTGAQVTALLSAASESAAGVVELATDAEAQAGTDTARVITPANMKAAQIRLGTAVASTSGTAIDFTGIPSWAKRITVMLSGVSTNGTSSIQLQLGTSGGVETTGYLGTTSFISNGASPTNTAHSAGALISNSVGAANVYHGVVTCVLINPASNTWGIRIETARSDAVNVYLAVGSKALAGVLDRVRITMTNGTDTFDAGTINVSWE